MTLRIITEDNKLPYIPTDRDFIEDTTHENGNYENICCICTEHFFGHKRRVVCKICQNKKLNVVK